MIIKEIIKRDGRTVPYSAEKISNGSSIEPGDTIVVPRRIAGNDWITPICDTLKGIASIIVMAFAINKW